MKILIIGDHPAQPNGLAEIIRLIFEGLLAGYPDTYHLAQVGLVHSCAVTQAKWRVWPTCKLSLKGERGWLAPYDLYDERTVQQAVEALKPDILFAIGNPHQLLHLPWANLKGGSKLVLYLRVDDVPLAPGIDLMLQAADLVITMSNVSSELLTSTFPEAKTTACLHPPADTERFEPVTMSERRELRQPLLPPWMPPDAFLLGWVGRAKWRKQIWVLYRLIAYLRSGNYLVCGQCGKVSPLGWDPVARSAVKPVQLERLCTACGSRSVSAAEPLRDVFLWLHTPLNDPLAVWPLGLLEHEYGVLRGADLHYTEGYTMAAALKPEDMPALYQLWDAAVHLSGSEGFALPAWEAMSSGLPVICTEHSGPAEYVLAARAGLVVSEVAQPERKTGFQRMIASLPSAIDAVRKLYFDRDLLGTLGANGRLFVQQYRPEIQLPKWHEIFQGLACGGRTSHSVSQTAPGNK